MYRADYTDAEKYYKNGKEVAIRWHPSIHMPKEAARIFLRVTNVRVERLQDIQTMMQKQRDVSIIHQQHLVSQMYGIPPSRNPILTATDGMQIRGYGLSSLSGATSRKARKIR